MEIPPIPSQGVSANLQTRVVNILTKPAQEWPVIASEPKDIAGLYRNYIVLLAAIPAVCGLIGMSVVGMTLPFGGGHFRVPIVTGIGNAVVGYVLGLVGVYVAALVIAKLAPTFQSQPDVAQAVKLVAYSSTPMWVAGVLSLVPALAVIGLLAGLYGLYIMYLGIGPLMKTPSDKTIPYMVVSIIVLIVLYVIVGTVAAVVMPTAPRVTL
jgi:peptidoglycan biosynthesis protein MviN/MurJ (putative lipid II flippase)